MKFRIAAIIMALACATASVSQGVNAQEIGRGASAQRFFGGGGFNWNSTFGSSDRGTFRFADSGNKQKASAPTKNSPRTAAPVLQGWMSSEIADAWAAGFQGQGANITFVDDFKSGATYSGNLGTGTQRLRHGEWTRSEATMIAPLATVSSQDFSQTGSVSLVSGKTNVINLSYAMFSSAGYSVNQIGWSAREISVMSHASGAAVISKAAGNDGVAIGSANKNGSIDYLNTALTGKASAIFVGALNSNGTVAMPTTMASYSNTAGNNPTVQKQFLTVGVRGDLTGLYGTSFAAPIVSGYAAVLSSKFTTATPTQITTRLLETARTDTVQNYDPSIYGRGEASISRALAPASIN